MITADLLAAIEAAAQKTAAEAPAPSAELLREALPALAPLAAAIRRLSDAGEVIS